MDWANLSPPHRRLWSAPIKCNETQTIVDDRYWLAPVALYPLAPPFGGAALLGAYVCICNSILCNWSFSSICSKKKQKKQTIVDCEVWFVSWVGQKWSCSMDSNFRCKTTFCLKYSRNQARHQNMIHSPSRRDTPLPRGLQLSHPRGHPEGCMFVQVQHKLNNTFHFSIQYPWARILH